MQATTMQVAATLLAGHSLNAKAVSGALVGKPGYGKKIAKRGVIPAALTPFKADMSVSLKDFQRHIKALSGTRGVTSILVNGGAGEISSLTRDERRMLVAEAVYSVGGETPIIAALEETDKVSLKTLAKDAEAEGASALMVMPPRDEINAQWKAASVRYNEVFSSTHLPVVIFQTIYSTETLTKLVENKQIYAIKAACKTPFEFEENFHSVKELRSDLAVWTTHTDRFFLDLALGADGIVSGTGSFAAGLHVELFNAVSTSNLFEARKICKRLFYLNRALRYSCVEHDNFAYAVMKYALVKLGIIEKAYVRPPNKPFVAVEQQKVIDDALKKSGLINSV